MLKSITCTAACAVIHLSCSVISPEYRALAIPRVTYENLVSAPDSHVGRMVILGGYLLNVDSQNSEIILTILNAPLMRGDEPIGIEYTDRRFWVKARQPIDLENYARYRRITVAGIFRGIQSDEPILQARNWPLIESREIHLWTDFDYDEGRFYNNDYYFPRAFPFYRPSRHALGH